MDADQLCPGIEEFDLDARFVRPELWDCVTRREDLATFTHVVPWPEVRRARPPKVQPGIRGVYFLLGGAQVVYIGQSVDCYSRLRQHQDKGYETFAIFPVAEDKTLNDVEASNILYYQPEYNVYVPPSALFVKPQNVGLCGLHVTEEWLRARVRTGELCLIQFRGQQYFIHDQVLDLWQREAR